MSNTIKLVLVVVLFAALAVIIFFQFQKFVGPPAGRRTEKVETPAPETKPAKEAQSPPAAQPKETPTEEKPKEVEAPTAPSEPAPAEIEAEKPEPAKPEEVKEAKMKERPKSPLISEKVEDAYRSSRFFERNQVTITRDPFTPIGVFPTMGVQTTGAPEGTLQQIFSGMPSGTTTQPGATPPSTAVSGEIPLLPLPTEPLGPPLKVLLIGVSKGSQSPTALFAITDAGGTVLEKFLARPGWAVGQDYVFIGLENARAKLLDTRTNKMIYLSTGGSV